MSVLLETSFGDIVIDLFSEKCPKSVKNFIKLCKMKFYNNALCLEIQKDRLAKFHDLKKIPTSIYEKPNIPNSKFFDDEIFPELLHNKFGLVCTANEGPNMNTSEVLPLEPFFLICSSFSFSLRNQMSKP